MVHGVALSVKRLSGAGVLGALASTALAVAGLGAAPPAQATCASFFGIGNSADCSSTVTSIAIAIGTGAQAHASGLFGSAFAVGDGSFAGTLAGGIFNTATTFGEGSSTTAGGYLTTAFVAGNSSSADASDAGGSEFGNAAFTLSSGGSTYAGKGSGNFAVSFFGGGPTEAYGNGNFAATIFAGGVAAALGTGSFAAIVGGSNNTANASGLFDAAISVLGNDNKVYAKGNPTGTATASFAFNVGGNGNTVQAGAGPLAIAGSVFQSGGSVEKIQPGIAINGLRIPNTATAVKPAPSAAAVGASNTGSGGSHTKRASHRS